MSFKNPLVEMGELLTRIAGFQQKVDQGLALSLNDLSEAETLTNELKKIIKENNAMTEPMEKQIRIIEIGIKAMRDSLEGKQNFN